MVVPVLITSCQVLENPKIGPVHAQTTTIARAKTKVPALPVAAATLEEILWNSSFIEQSYDKLMLLRYNTYKHKQNIVKQICKPPHLPTSAK